MTGVIATIPKFQFANATGTPLANGTLTVYLAGTTTLTNTWQDQALSALNTNPITLDSRGECVLWLDSTVNYKFVLKNSSGVVQWTQDNLSGAGAGSASLSTALAASTGAGLVGFLQAGTGAVARTVQSKARERISIEDFGGDPTGVSDCTAAAAAAMNYLRSVGGGVLSFNAGTYLFNGAAGTDTVPNGILFSFTSDNATANRIIVEGKGKATVLKAGSNNMILVRMSDSHCGLKNISLDGNGKFGVIAQALIPEDQTQTTIRVSQSYNYSDGVYIRGCDEGIVQRCGPVVAALDSGCFYNTFANYHIYDTVRGIWLRTATTPLSSTVNRNKFQNIRIGGSGTRVNTGVQIDSGDTNTLTGVDCEGITNVTGPNATATAYKIAMTDASAALDNNSNVLISCKAEGCTRDLDNANAYTELYGALVAGAKSLFTAIPKVIIGGSDPSVTPQVVPGYRFQNAASFPGVDQGVMWMDGGLANGPLNYAYDQGSRWATYAVTVGICSNVTSIVEYHSKFQRLGGMVDWHLRFKFQATAAGTSVTVLLPRTPSTQYTSFSGQQPSLFQVCLVGALGAQSVGLARFDAATPGLITIYAPAANWHASANSEIHLHLRYIETGF
jgi:hypothetical protein